jgi:copper chaperone
MFRESTPVDLTYMVPGVSCSHCQGAIRGEVGRVLGVTAVDVDLVQKRVTVRGESFDDAVVRAAIEDAGYELEP